MRLVGLPPRERFENIRRESFLDLARLKMCCAGVHDVIDWLGVSIYGWTDPDTWKCATFSSQLTNALGESCSGQRGTEKLQSIANLGERKTG